jgi:hypothetical protein
VIMGKMIGVLAFLALGGISAEASFASTSLHANLDEMCVCNTTRDFNNKLTLDPCITAAKAQLAEANRLGESVEGRHNVIELARRVKEIASCDIGLATDVAALAALAPDWVQVTFGAALDGTGTGSVRNPTSPTSGSAAGSPS